MFDNKIYKSITELVGKTPILRLSNIEKVNNLECQLLSKLENFNPLSSVKDRIAVGMIEDAFEKGQVDCDTVIIEPTSGNTGIGLAFVCASKGLKLILTMPENMSEERRKLLKILGAELVLTSAKDGMKGAIDMANQIKTQNKNSFIPSQFDNSVNPQTHYKTTAQEILNATNGNIDFFVAGVGSGGTISGVAKRLKEFNPKICVVAVEPFESQVISGKSSNTHGIQGIGANFIPSNFNISVVDEVLPIKTQDAIQSAKDLAKNEGVLAGISSGANLCASIQIAKRSENKGKTILTLCADTGERYLSTQMFD